MDKRPTVVCAWCGATIQDGGRFVSHGLCRLCEPAVLRSLLAAAREIRK